MTNAASFVSEFDAERLVCALKHVDNGNGYICVTPLSLTIKFRDRGRKTIKSFARVSLTKFLVNQIDKNVAMATSK